MTASIRPVHRWLLRSDGPGAGSARPDARVHLSPNRPVRSNDRDGALVDRSRISERREHSVQDAARGLTKSVRRRSPPPQGARRGSDARGGEPCPGRLGAGDHQGAAQHADGDGEDRRHRGDEIVRAGRISVAREFRQPDEAERAGHEEPEPREERRPGGHRRWVAADQVGHRGHRRRSDERARRIRRGRCCR